MRKKKAPKVCSKCGGATYRMDYDRATDKIVPICSKCLRPNGRKITKGQLEEFLHYVSTPFERPLG